MISIDHTALLYICMPHQQPGGSGALHQEKTLSGGGEQGIGQDHLVHQHGL